MKLLIVRHGDPDYSIDSLTEKGWREAEYLSEKLINMEVTNFYVSPLGRAKDTACCTLKKVNRKAEECQCLREFGPAIWRPDVKEYKKNAWDWLPEDWTRNECFFHYDQWQQSEVMEEGQVKKEYDWVIQNFDQLLEKHGYVRDGHCYRVEKGNQDTLVFFCHFGVGCVLISHLLNVSPMVLWHGTCAAPSSVTTIVTEERRQGLAYFRMSSYGDVSHLYAHGEPPAFAARFCERFENLNERHD